MDASQAAAAPVVTSSSYVIVPRQDPLPKLVYAVTLLVLGVACFIALVVLLSAALPGLRERARETLREHPWRALLVGLVGYLALGSLAALLFSQSYVTYLLRTEFVPGMLAAAISVCAVLLLATLLGATGTVAALADRLRVLDGQDGGGLRRTAWSALTLVLASLFPIVGWLLVLPGAMLLSFGAALLALRRRRPGR